MQLVNKRALACELVWPKMELSSVFAGSLERSFAAMFLSVTFCQKVPGHLDAARWNAGQCRMPQRDCNENQWNLLILNN